MDIGRLLVLIGIYGKPSIEIQIIAQTKKRSIPLTELKTIFFIL